MASTVFQRITQVKLALKEPSGKYVIISPEAGVALKEITVQQICFPNEEDVSKWTAVWVRYPISSFEIEGFFNPLITYDYSSLIFIGDKTSQEPIKAPPSVLGNPLIFCRLWDKFSEYWSCPQKFIEGFALDYASHLNTPTSPLRLKLIKLLENLE